MTGRLAAGPRCRSCRASLRLVLAAALVLALPSKAQEELPTVPYTVTISGPISDAMQALLEEVSESRRLTTRPPPSVIILRRRAADDRPRLIQALRSRGYYAAEVAFAVDTEVSPARVTFEVEPGEPFRLDAMVVEAEPPAFGFVPPEPEALGLASGAPAEAEAILAAETELLARTRMAGHPFAELGQRRAVVDHRSQTMDVTLRVRPGPPAQLGDVTFEGVQGIEIDFLERRIPWGLGEPYRPELVDEARRSLLDTNLFSAVRLYRAETLDAEGRLHYRADVTQRAHRSIGAGLRYLTDEGPGANLFWEHRNLLRRGERLQVSADGSGIGYELSANLRKPDFRRRHQHLIAEARSLYQDTDAFVRRSVGGGIGLEREIRTDMTASAGVAYRAVRITDVDGREEFALLSLPTTFEWDRSDDLLDPTRGDRMSLLATPFVDTLGSDVLFGRLVGRYSRYLRVSERPRVVFAGRLALGGMVGAGRAAIPADERFYAGGGGSVRGIGFQLASPLGANDRPIGGRSLFEAALEVRARLTETIGAVAFLDAGRAFQSSFPDFGERIQMGAGFGLRYHTIIGPVRLDVALPLDRRPVDDSFQIYISIGQAF